MVRTVKPPSPPVARNSPGRFRALKARAYGSIAEIVTRAIAQVGGAKDAMVVLDLKSSAFYDIADPGEAKELRHGQIRALVRAGGVALAEDLAQLAGCLLLPVPADEGASGLHLRTSESAASFGAYMAEVVAGLADGRLDPAEARRVAAAIDEVLRDLMAMRAEAIAIIDAAEAAL